MVTQARTVAADESTIDLSTMDFSSIALQGLQPADAQLTTAAAAIAGGGGASENGANPDVVELSAEVVALMSAQTQLAANVATLNTADEVQQSLLDVTA